MPQTCARKNKLAPESYRDPLLDWDPRCSDGESSPRRPGGLYSSDVLRGGRGEEATRWQPIPRVSALRQGKELIDEPRLVRVAPQDRRAIAEEALLPTRLIDPLLAHLVRQGAIVAGAGSRFAPADPAGRGFIADGWRRSRLASARGQRAACARIAREPRQHPWRDQGSSSALRAVPIGRNMRRGHPSE